MKETLAVCVSVLSDKHDKQRSNDSKFSTTVDANFFRINPQQTISYPKPEYLKQLRNPCFYADVSSLDHLR